MVFILPPKCPLPFSDSYSNEEEYIVHLLEFVTTSETLQTLCGGVHILDFLTRQSDLYEAILAPDWRSWLNGLEIADVLDFLMREDLSDLTECERVSPRHLSEKRDLNGKEAPKRSWRGHSLPPQSLVEYVATVRKLSLNRDFVPQCELGLGLSRSVAAGMNRKKLHEVERFASFIDELATHVSQGSVHQITHLVDFGSGQNYLGRVLASPPCQRRVVAVERKPINIDGAKRKDVAAKLTKKKAVWRNKKSFRLTGVDDAGEAQLLQAEEQASQSLNTKPIGLSEDTNRASAKGRIEYVQQSLSDGNLVHIVESLTPWSSNQACRRAVDMKPQSADGPNRHSRSDAASQEPELLVISLHSCGNLTHHGLRSLVLNPSVKAVAIVGCCYNLCTERLGPQTFKLPNLRSHNKRLEETSAASDLHGFPMSERFVEYRCGEVRGIRFNITARMMAVQAPQNWTQAEYESFFTRHFYRALLQRLFLDQGFIGRPENASEGRAGSAAGSGGEPIIIGSLRKACYTSFVSYVRGALAKLASHPELGPRADNSLSTLTDAEIAACEDNYRTRRHHLCILWSLMAFSAGVVESAIVVDRWLYLREQPGVKTVWVQTVFEYEKSPRNLVIVGIKK